LSRRYLRLTDRWTSEYEPYIAAVIRKQLKEAAAKLREGGERALRAHLDTWFFDERFGKVVSKLFRSFVMSYAQATYSRLMRASRKKVKAETGAFGFSEEWNQAITDYLNQFVLTRATIPYTEGTKKQILKVLLTGQAEGWGIDRIIQELEQEDGLNNTLTLFRARRIVRTELSIAANFADKLVQDSVPFEVEKTWISVKDNRTRDSHEQMDGVTIEGDADFHVPIIRKKVQVGIDLMSGPGDPEATPGNIINCRCTKGLVPKRDKKGRLITKPQKIRP
jgi:uncharacterized protein with gpF-like domain